MLGGDISNETAPGVGVRFERIIRTQQGRLNRSAKAYLQSLVQLDVNIHIITTGDSRKCMAFCAKWAVPYSKVIAAESDLEIPDIVNENVFIYYYDVDKNLLSNVNSRSRGSEAKLWTQVEDS